MGEMGNEYNLLWSRCYQESPVLILGHGAGAPKDSVFMDTMAGLIYQKNISVVRFNFPYMEKRVIEGKRNFPDPKPKLLKRWSEVLEYVNSQTKAPVFIGGKSMGGRMATLLLAEQPMLQSSCSGVICLGYPFYSPKKYENPRVDHFKCIKKPILILQGERDNMGNKDQVTGYLLSKNIKFKWFLGAGHDLKPLKSIGISYETYLEKASLYISTFIKSHV